MSKLVGRLPRYRAAGAVKKSLDQDSWQEVLKLKGHTLSSIPPSLNQRLMIILEQGPIKEHFQEPPQSALWIRAVSHVSSCWFVSYFIYKRSQGGSSWRAFGAFGAFGERKIIPQSFCKACFCKFSRRKRCFFYNCVNIGGFLLK